MKKYLLISRYKLYYIVVSLLSFIPLTPLIYIFLRVPVFNVFMFTILSTIIIRFVYWIQYESITITPETIEYNTPGMILVVKWKDIEEISHCWRFLIRQECLVLDRSNSTIKEWALYANTYSHPLKNYLQSVAIPLSCFSENWRDTELGQQIKQYAPHLFENKQSA